MGFKKIDCDILIVGAGLLGSSVALHLAENTKRKITVVDLDLEGVFSSSELNAGGVRATWNHPVNAAISRASIQYFSSVAEEIGFRQKGYFWMYSKEHWPIAQKILKANERLKNLNIEYIDVSEIHSRFDFVDKVDDLGGATFSPFDGLLNANLVKLHYRKKAKTLGQVEFLNRYWINKVEILPDKTIELEAAHWDDRVSDETLKQVLTLKSTEGSSKVKFTAKTLVNCSGAWANRFARCLRIPPQSIALRRQVSVFECREVNLTDYGMFVDSSGVYFHPEANNILGGFAVPEELAGYNFEYEGESFFEQYIWPNLYNRSSKFESLKHITGWAGLYEVSPDKSGIVGRVPGFENVFEAHSFSGRGAMQSYAAGLALAELIALGEYRSIDLSCLGGDRFHTGKLISEGMLI